MRDAGLYGDGHEARRFSRVLSCRLSLIGLRVFGSVKDQAAEEWPLYGHGNGLFWDEPLLSHGYRGKHGVIRQNMVMSTETFMATEGVGSAGFEQNFIVTAEGTELITNTPLLWWD